VTWSHAECSAKECGRQKATDMTLIEPLDCFSTDVAVKMARRGGHGHGGTTRFVWLGD
jgi:hypothetical protein